MIDKDLLEREEMLEDILDALEDGDLEEAEDLADEAIEEFPNEAFGYYYMGEALFLQSDLEEAYEYFQQAVSKAPDNSDYLGRFALINAKLNEEEKARLLYNKVLQLNPSHVDSLIASGVYALNDEKYEDALDYLNRAISVDNNYSIAYKIRCIIHSNLTNFKEALDDIDMAIKYDSENSELWLQKISLHVINDDNKSASDAYKSWIALQPDDTNRYAAYANFLMDNEDFKNAELQFDKAVEMEIYGEFAAINSILGRAWSKLYQNKTSEAISDFSKVISLDSKLAEPYIGMADARVKEGSLEAASTYLDLGLDVVFDDAWYLLNKKGIINVSAANWDIAKGAFQEMIDLDDEEIQAEGHFGMGKLHQAMGNIELAFRSWRKASDIFHLEADECIEDYCQEFLEMELKEKEDALLLDMQQDFLENKKSPLLNNFFPNFWIADIKTTASKNKMFAQIPAKMEKQIMGLLQNICVALVHKGIMVLNPGYDGVRMLYSIENEDAKEVVINGIPLNGSNKREFRLSLVGNHMLLKGFGDEDADIDLYLKAVNSVSELPEVALKDLKSHAVAGDLDFMGEDFLNSF